MAKGKKITAASIVKKREKELMLFRSEFARLNQKLDDLLKTQYQSHSMFGEQIEEIYQLIKTKGIDTEQLVDEITKIGKSA